MRYGLIIVGLAIVTAALAAMNVYYAVQTGSAISWAAAYFITACLMVELVSYSKIR